MKRTPNRSGNRLWSWRKWWNEMHIGRRSVRIAMDRFSCLHPHWHGAFFDQHFIGRIPVTTLERLDGESLAREWARQFRYSDERQRMIDVRQVTPVAESFLRLLESARQELSKGKARAGEIDAQQTGTLVSRERTDALAVRSRAQVRTLQGPFGPNSTCPEIKITERTRRHE